MIKKAHKVIHTRTHNDLMCHCPVPNCCIDISEAQRFNMTLEPLPAGFEMCLTQRTYASYFHSRELGSNENTTGGAYCHRRIFQLYCPCLHAANLGGSSIVRLALQSLQVTKICSGVRPSKRISDMKAWAEWGKMLQVDACGWAFCKHDSTARGIPIATFRIGTKLSAFLALW